MVYIITKSTLFNLSAACQEKQQEHSVLYESLSKLEYFVRNDILHINLIKCDFLQVRGSMRVILRPLIPAAPLVGGISVFFLNRPVS